MQIITSHNSLDFDGLAAMVAAGKLYPAAVKVQAGTLSKNVKQFMGLYKDMLLVKSPRELKLDEVTCMIVVDTKNANRLGRLKHLALRPGMSFHIFDHHPSCPDDLTGVVEQVEEVGATTTILVEKIIEYNIPISSFDATVMALGIYEDTGSLLFSSTTPRDAAAVAFLLSRGANLAVVANFIEEPFSGEQRMLLQNLLQTARHYQVKGADILLATSETDQFIPGLDLVTHRLGEIEPADAVFVVAMMEGKANIVARSRSNGVKVNEILAPLGGRGHAKAAAAMVRDRNLEAVISDITKGLGEVVRPGLVARDIMSSPVKTVPAHTTVEEAGRLMLRYGHTGMPVLEGDRIVGIISRRDVDKARLHDLGHAPVKGFMSSGIVSVTPDTLVTDIQKIMVERDIGRLPVVEQGNLVGIVSRTDILRTLHGDDGELDDHEILYEDGGSHRFDCRQLLAERLPARIRSDLEIAGKVAEEMGYAVYIVGGVVRDLLLGVPNYDIDLVVEGDGPEFARQLAQQLRGRARVHNRFQTAMVILPDGFKIDVATARTEYYEFPAALPTVERSSLREDLYRRDFTINTMAACLNPGRFGQLIDYFGGRKDLEAGLIRVLYNLSFVEDPTRILRAIRFEQRYKFQIEPETLRLARDAIERRLLGKLSYKRIWHELQLILEEKDPLPALRRMEEIGVWGYVLPEAKPDSETWIMLRRIPPILGWLAERWLHPQLRPWLIYLLVIFSRLTAGEVDVILKRYQFDREAVNTVVKAREIPALAREIEESTGMKMSVLDKKLRQVAIENIVYLLMCLTNPESWENVVRYLELREDAQVQVSGHDLKRLGLKQGPLYQQILSELRDARLDGLVKTYDQELNLVREWIAEGRFNTDGKIN